MTVTRLAPILPTLVAALALACTGGGDADPGLDTMSGADVSSGADTTPGMDTSPGVDGGGPDAGPSDTLTASDSGMGYTTSAAQPLDLTDSPGEAGVRIEVDGLERAFLLDVPRGYVPGQPAPLLVVHHGGGQRARDFRDNHPDLRRVAQDEGLILVWPQGSPVNGKPSWFSYDEGTRPLPEGVDWVDDVHFVLTMVDRVAATFSVDMDRIYLAGFSGGGRMAHQIAAHHPDRIAAIAAVGSLVGSSIGPGEDELIWIHDPSGPVPVLMLHGKRDTAHPWDGGVNQDGDYNTSIAEAEALWREAGGCTGDPVVEIQAPPFERRRSLDCDDGVEVQVILVDRLAHIWPDADDGVGIDANAVVPAFLLGFGR